MGSLFSDMGLWCLLVAALSCQTLPTLYSRIISYSRSRPYHSRASPLFLGAKGRGRRDSRPFVCQSHLPPKACFITKSMFCCWGPAHLHTSHTQRPGILGRQPAKRHNQKRNSVSRRRKRLMPGLPHLSPHSLPPFV